MLANCRVAQFEKIDDALPYLLSLYFVFDVNFGNVAEKCLLLNCLAIPYGLYIEKFGCTKTEIQDGIEDLKSFRVNIQYPRSWPSL